MKKMKLNLLFVAASMLLVLLSCEKEPEGKDTGFTHGAFIVNEGAYGQNNGSITHYNMRFNDVSQHVFQSANDMRSLGDVVQSFAVVGDMGFIVVNNSQKTEVVDLETFKSITTLFGLDYPRYVLQVSDEKAYITNGAFAGHVYLIDLNTLLINSVKRIDVGKGPEQMIKAGEKIYVANSGGWDIDSTVSIIDPVTDEVVATVETGKGPVDFVEDADGNIWVYCKGHYSYDDQYNVIIDDYPVLACIDGNTNTLTKSFDIPVSGGNFSPNRIAVSQNGNTLYMLEVGGIYKMDISDTELPSEPFIPGMFNGIDVDPDGYIYLMTPVYDSNSEVGVYNENGEQIHTILAGIGANSAVFN